MERKGNLKLSENSLRTLAADFASFALSKPASPSLTVGLLTRPKNKSGLPVSRKASDYVTNWNPDLRFHIQESRLLFFVRQ